MRQGRPLLRLLSGLFAAVVLVGCGATSAGPTVAPAPPTSTTLPIAPTAAAVLPTATPVPATAIATSLPPTTPLPIPTISSSATAYEDWVALFDYDPTIPVEIAELGTEKRGNVSIQDIAFPSPYGKQVTAYLVTPEGAGPHPAILYVHWYESGAKDSNRQEFLEEAVKLADEGVVSLLVDDLFALPGARRLWTKSNAAADAGLVIQQVVELRRALDLLTARADVDPQRIAYVGHDFGGLFGAVLAGVDPRVKTYVIMAAIPKFSDWFLLGSSLVKKDKDAYRAQLAPVEPIQYVGHAAPASFFFQFARKDDYVSEAQATALTDAASEPKRIGWYDGGHDLQKSDAATGDRLEWLRTQLGLKP